MKKLLVADLFCGAGGTTSGALEAIDSLGREVEFVAVNHWPVAISTHKRNHPNVRHYCRDLDTANPCEIVPEGYLDLLLASPECRFHSPAQGGRPLDEQNRASAWHVTRWAERLYIKRIVVENVPRFVKWGPLDRRGRPIKKREGELFLAWVGTLEAIGYRVEWRVLNAADYGTPQTRKRLFIQARRDGRRIVWPAATHARHGAEQTLHGALETWTPARSAIRFDKYRHLARPIEEKNLSPKTLARIAEGVRRFCSGAVPESFMVTLRNTRGGGPEDSVTSLEDPLRTIAAGGNHHSLIEAFALGNDEAPPVPLQQFLIAHFDAIGVAEPFICANRTNNVARSVDDPMAALTTSPGGGQMLIEPFLLPQQAHPCQDLDDPLPTIVANNPHHAVIEPFIVPQDQGAPARSVDDPLPTLRTTTRGLGMIEPFLLVKRQHDEARSLEDPLPTITTSGRNHFVVEPYLVESTHGKERPAKSVDEPLPTLTQKNGIGLVEPQVEGGRLVLLHRMLQPEELAFGQDFEDYEFTGTREEQTKQIGNAVPIKLARAMTAVAFYDLPAISKAVPA